MNDGLATMASGWRRLPGLTSLGGRLMAALALLAAQAIAPAAAAAAEAAREPAKKASRSAQGPKAPPATASAKAKGQPRADLAPSAVKAVEERTPIEDEPPHALSLTELEVARAVHVGPMACELGASVTVTPLRHEGFFLVSTSKGQRFRMHPTESRTGAIRLEDPKRGAMWLQLGNKSMLMSQKLGQRLADECQSPAQVAFAEAMKKNPPPGLLDAAPQAAPAAPAN